MIYCQHDDCRVTTIDELLVLALVTRREDVRQTAWAMLTTRLAPRVRCRHVDKSKRPMNDD